MKERTGQKDDRLDKLQARLGIKIRRSDAFDFCYYNFYELFEFQLWQVDDIVRLDSSGKAVNITYKEKRRLVQLCRQYNEITETFVQGRRGKDNSPRVPLRHCLQSLERSFNKHFDDLLFITHEEEKIYNQNQR